MSADKYNELMQKAINASHLYDKDRSIETLLGIKLEIKESYESLSPKDSSDLIRQVEEFIRIRKMAKWRELYDSSDKNSLEQMAKCKSELESINNEHPGDPAYPTTVAQIKNKIESLKRIKSSLV